MQNFKKVQLACSSLKKALPSDLYKNMQGGCGIILGTGLSELATDIIKNPLEIPFSSITGFPTSSVDSHKGVFIFGKLNNMGIIFQCGRVHLYEGYTPDQICMGIRIMKTLGIKNLIITNSAGALNPLYNAGSIMLAADIINHTGTSPLLGTNFPQWGERFPDMSIPFSKELSTLAENAALHNFIHLEKGVYIGVHGPEMETPAETRMYRKWGADAIGMSTALEVIAANHLGINCICLSCLTNKNLPDCMEAAPIDYVIKMAKKIEPQLKLLLIGILNKLAANYSLKS